MPVPTITWKNDALRLIDQTLLPEEYKFITCRDVNTVAEAIVSLRVRGAPAIGVSAAYGVVIAAQEAIARDADFDRYVAESIQKLAQTRPTAVNLFWALDRQEKVLAKAASHSPAEKRDRLLKEAHEIFEDDKRICRQIGRHGAELLSSQATVLTHCNAGGPGHGRLRHGLSSGLRRCRSGQTSRGLCRRNPATLTGVAPHGLGTESKRRRCHRDMR